MDDDRGFLKWFETTWHDAEMALHQGDAGPRDQITWSKHEPVTLFGAWRNAKNAGEAREVFRALEASHTRTTVDGEPREYTLRVTQVYRHEDGTWKVIHRHGDHEAAATP